MYFMLIPIAMYGVWLIWAKARGEDTTPKGKPRPWVTASETDWYGHELTDKERRRNRVVLLIGLIVAIAIGVLIFEFMNSLDRS